MGGILDAAGLPGFLGRREAIYQEADRETQEWKAVCDAWYERHGTLPVSANDVWDLCKERTLLLEMWGGRERLSALQRIGRALTRHRGRVYGACRIVGAGRDKTSGRARYRLEQVSRKTPETPETPSSVDHPADVLGVSDVFSAPPEPALSEESAQLRQRLLGATEGEL